MSAKETKYEITSEDYKTRSVNEVFRFLRLPASLNHNWGSRLVKVNIIVPFIVLDPGFIRRVHNDTVRHSRGRCVYFFVTDNRCRREILRISLHGVCLLSTCAVWKALPLYSFRYIISEYFTQPSVLCCVNITIFTPLLIRTCVHVRRSKCLRIRRYVDIYIQYISLDLFPFTLIDVWGEPHGWVDVFYITYIQNESPETSKRMNTSNIKHCCSLFLSSFIPLCPVHGERRCTGELFITLLSLLLWLVLTTSSSRWFHTCVCLALSPPPLTLSRLSGCSIGVTSWRGEFVSRTGLSVLFLSKILYSASLQFAQLVPSRGWQPLWLSFS